MIKTKTINNSRVICRLFSSTAAATLLAGLISLCGGRNARATIYTLTIPDTVPWTDTGINIAAGSEIQITASGTATFGFSAGQSCGPNGTTGVFYPGSVVPSAVSCSLIGKTGGTTGVGTGTLVPEGTPGDGTGFVGASYDKTISTGGELFLGFNDQVGGFSDNSGSFSVTLNVLPVPEPSIMAFVGLGGLAFWARRRTRAASA